MHCLPRSMLSKSHVCLGAHYHKVEGDIAKHGRYRGFPITRCLRPTLSVRLACSLFCDCSISGEILTLSIFFCFSRKYGSPTPTPTQSVFLFTAAVNTICGPGRIPRLIGHWGRAVEIQRWSMVTGCNFLLSWGIPENCEVPVVPQKRSYVAAVATRSASQLCSVWGVCLTAVGSGKAPLGQLETRANAPTSWL